MKDIIQTDIAKTLAYIEENYMHRLTLSSISANVSLSSSYLCRVFKSEVGTSITSYLNNLRIRKAMIKATDDQGRHTDCLKNVWEFPLLSSVISFSFHAPYVRRSAVLPCKINRNAARCFETPYLSILPFLRKRRKKKNPVVLILHQHFQQSCIKPKISVNLKWWMCTEHIRVGSATDQTAVFFSCNVKLIFQKLQRTLSSPAAPIDTPSMPCTSRFPRPLFCRVPHGRQPEVPHPLCGSDFRDRDRIAVNMSVVHIHFRIVQEPLLAVPAPP